jgi:hypothetical protein
MHVDISDELASAPLLGEDRAAAALWMQHATLKTLSETDLIRRLFTLRRYNRAAYLWLIHNHLQAAAIKVKRRWHDPEDEISDWNDPDAILASIRGITDQAHFMAVSLMNMLRHAVASHAPHNLHLVPEILHTRMAETSDPAATMTPPPHTTQARTIFETKQGRKLGALTPEQLKAARMDNPTSRTLVEPVASDPPQPESKPSESDPSDFASAAAANAADVHADHAGMPWDDPP